MGTYYNVITGSRIADSARSDQSGSDDTAVTNWTIGDDFILAVHMDDASKDTAAGTYKLQWKKGEGGSFTDLANTGELNWNGDTSLENGTACAQAAGDWICSYPTVNGGTYIEGVERESSNDTVAFDGTDGDETEHQWAINCDGATAGTTYYFQTVDTANGNRVDSIAVTIAMAAASPKELDENETNLDLDGSDHPAVSVDRGASLKNSAHSHISEIDTPTIGASASAANSIHSISGTHPELDVAGVQELVPISPEHIQVAETPQVNQATLCSVVSPSHELNGADHPAISTSQNQILAPIDSEHGLTSDTLDVSGNISSNANSTVNENIAETFDLNIEAQIGVIDSILPHEISVPDVDTSKQVEATDSICAIESGKASLTLLVNQAANNPQHAIENFGVSFAGSATVEAQGANHANIAEIIDITKIIGLENPNVIHSHTAEIIDFQTGKSIPGKDAQHTVQNEAINISFSKGINAVATQHSFSRSEVYVLNSQILNSIDSNLSVENSSINFVTGLRYGANFVSRDSPYIFIAKAA